MPLLQNCPKNEQIEITEKVATILDANFLPIGKRISLTLIQGCSICASDVIIRPLQAIFQLATIDHDTGLFMLRFIAQRLGFKSNLDLIGFALPKIISNWDHTLLELPYRLGGFKNLQSFINAFKMEFIEGIIISNRFHDLQYIPGRLEPLNHKIYARCLVLQEIKDSISNFQLHDFKPNNNTRIAILVKFFTHIQDLNPFDKDFDPRIANMIGELSLPSNWFDSENEIFETTSLMNVVAETLGIRFENIVDEFSDSELFSFLFHFHDALINNHGTANILRTFKCGYVLMLVFAKTLIEKHDLVIQYCCTFILQYVESLESIEIAFPLLHYLVKKCKGIEVISKLLCRFNEKYTKLGSDRILVLMESLIKKSVNREICGLTLDTSNPEIKSMFEKFASSEPVLRLEPFEFWFVNIRPEDWGLPLCHLDNLLNSEIVGAFNTKGIRNILDSQRNPPTFDSKRYNNAYFSVIVKLNCFNVNLDQSLQRNNDDPAILKIINKTIGFLDFKDVAQVNLALNSLNMSAKFAKKEDFKMVGDLEFLIPFSLLDEQESEFKLTSVLDWTSKNVDENVWLKKISLDLINLSSSHDNGITAFGLMVDSNSYYSKEILEYLFQHLIFETTSSRVIPLVAKAINEIMAQPNLNIVGVKYILHAFKVSDFN